MAYSDADPMETYFAWLPVESIIHDRQDEYYAAINHSNYEAESTAFIEFMLSAIKEALMQAVQTILPAAGSGFCREKNAIYLPYDKELPVKNLETIMRYICRENEEDL